MTKSESVRGGRHVSYKFRNSKHGKRSTKPIRSISRCIRQRSKRHRQHISVASPTHRLSCRCISSIRKPNSDNILRLQRKRRSRRTNIRYKELLHQLPLKVKEYIHQVINYFFIPEPLLHIFQPLRHHLLIKLTVYRLRGLYGISELLGVGFVEAVV